MAKTAVANAVKKGWVALVIVIVILVGGLRRHSAAQRLRFSHDNHPITSGSADEIKPFNPKHVVYEVTGTGPPRTSTIWISMPSRSG